MATRIYDYIVVGAGTAGCALAARLSEDKDVRVLLVEAGGRDWNPLFHVPAGFARMTKGIASWGYSTVPQKGMGGRVFWYTQAKVLGGGSSINAQIYTRGHPSDYDNWATLGCTGWSYAEVLPYFRRSEDNDTWNNELHGQGGPIGVSQPAAPLPICDAFFAAAGEIGIPHLMDLAGRDTFGVGYYQLFQRNARRSSAVQGYIAPARKRPNFTLAMVSHVSRVLIENGRAVGVEVYGPGQGDVATCRATREVIVCAGAIGSPRLLLHSGIGPAEHLKSVGVRPVLDLPGVGSNLQDHVDMCVICECTGEHTYDRYQKLHWAAVAGARYYLTRSGPAASSLFESGGFARSSQEKGAPDIQFHLGLGSGIEAGIAKLKNNGVTLNATIMRPRARGTVRLADNDPTKAPLIDPNFWGEAYDRQCSLDGVRLAREIMRQKALKPFVLAERVPGPDVKSDADLIEYGHRHAKTDHHPAGTCAMGTGDDAVVDPQLRVRGLSGLRVVDASIMPRVISSNTNAVTYMIAEKAADLIRGRSA
jgi:choline dehydrogenase-like flavoprotein